MGGLRVSITGTKGRIEMDIEESITHLLGDGEASASKGPFKQTRMRVFPMFGKSYEVPVSVGEGGHGGPIPSCWNRYFHPTRRMIHLIGRLRTSMGRLRFWSGSQAIVRCKRAR